MHDSDATQALNETSRLLAMTESCADTRDLETLLSRAASVLMQAGQADLVGFALPPAATPHGPSLHVSSRCPTTPLTERSVRESTVQALYDLGIDPPPADAFIITG